MPPYEITMRVDVPFRYTIAVEGASEEEVKKKIQDSLEADGLQSQYYVQNKPYGTWLPDYVGITPNNITIQS